MTDNASRERVRVELERGALARAQGQEGRARVCARRAAGEAARVFFMRQGSDVRGRTAYDLLQNLAQAAGISEELRQAALRLLQRVDEGYQLPAEIDLLQDARRIAQAFDLLSDDDNTAN